MIASQALISGAFSLTRQAMLLGYLPRVTIKHTAYHTEGQIYIPEVNNLLAIGCIAARADVSRVGEAGRGIRHRGHRDHGDHVDSLLHRGAHTWGWSRWRAGALLALFLAFDIPFLVANLFKFLEGGYVPMLIGATLIAGMLIWSRGRTALLEQYSTRYPTLEAAQPFIRRWLSSRVPGTAVFLAPSADHVPPILVHHVQRTRSLHEAVVLLTVLKVDARGSGRSRYELPRWKKVSTSSSSRSAIWKCPHLLPVLRAVVQCESSRFDFENATYYIGHETIVASDEGVISRVPEAIFSYLNRNAVHEERHYGMPADQIVEIGTQIDL